MISLDKRIFSLQGHPEYTSVWHITSNAGGKLSYNEAKEYFSNSIERYNKRNDYKIWRFFINEFVNSD